MKRVNKAVRGLVLAFLTLFFLNAPLAAAVPYLSSAYYCLADGDSGQIILSRQADVVRPVASTTKMMTAILATEYAGSKEIATVSSHAQKTPQYSIGLRAGQEVEVAELLKAALIRSANDAAVVLAEHVAGEERFFAHLMSKKAFTIGAVNTHFCNASGLPSADHYSTAYDLTRIGSYLLEDGYLKGLVASRRVQFQHPGYHQPMLIDNTNTLLDNYPGADGIKTGTTNAAGKCLVASATRNGRRLIAVALKSGNRSNDCASLLDYGFQSTQLMKMVDKNVPFKQVKVANGRCPYVELYPAEDIYVWAAGLNPDIQKRVKVNYVVQPPLKAGQKLGSMSVYADNQLVRSTELICRQDVGQELNPVRRFLQNLKVL
ncbi:D-alanyl-D-alanine carboxypeptidase family protein [Syntrophomonas curvata]